MNNTNAGSASPDISGAPEFMTLPGSGASYEIEHAIADLVKREFSIEVRLARAVRHHKPRKHLVRYQHLVKALELAA